MLDFDSQSQPQPNDVGHVDSRVQKQESERFLALSCQTLTDMLLPKPTRAGPFGWLFFFADLLLRKQYISSQADILKKSSVACSQHSIALNQLLGHLGEEIAYPSVRSNSMETSDRNDSCTGIGTSCFWKTLLGMWPAKGSPSCRSHSVAANDGADIQTHTLTHTQPNRPCMAHYQTRLARLKLWWMWSNFGMKATFEHLGFSSVWLRRLTKAINNELRKGWVTLFGIDIGWQMRQTFSKNNVVFGCGLADSGVILSKFQSDQTTNRTSHESW